MRARSQSFFDHFSQATLFFNSQSDAEKNHLTNALRFELGKVQRVEIRQRMVGLLSQVDKVLAANVAEALGLSVPKKPEQPLNHSIPADGVPAKFQPKTRDQGLEISKALSMANTVKGNIRSRKVAVLVADGADGNQIESMRKTLSAAGAVVEIIAPKLGNIITASGAALAVDKSLMTVSSVLYDAVYIPGTAKSVGVLSQKTEALEFISQAYKHCKAIAFESEADSLIQKTMIAGELKSNKDIPGIIYPAGKNINLSKDFHSCNRTTPVLGKGEISRLIAGSGDQPWGLKFVLENQKEYEKSILVNYGWGSDWNSHCAGKRI